MLRAARLVPCVDVSVSAEAKGQVISVNRGACARSDWLMLILILIDSEGSGTT